MKIKKFLIIVILVLNLNIFSSCSAIGVTKYGPFHRQAFINVPKFVSQSKLGKYCVVNNKIYEVVGNTFIEKIIEYDKVSKEGAYNYIEDINVTDEYIFIKTNYYIYMFDINLKMVEKINISTTHFLVIDQNIYFTKGVAPYTNLYKYNIYEKNITTIGLLNNNCVTDINNTSFFVNEHGRILRLNTNNCNVFIANRYNYTWIQQKWIDLVVNEQKCLLKFENQALTFKINNNSYFYNILNSNMYYEKVIVNNHEVYFATYEYIENNNCSEKCNCICRFGKSYIWCLNINNNEIKLVKDFEPGSYIINFDENSYCYYLNGKVFLNDEVKQDIIKVEPKGEYYIEGEDNYSVGDEASMTLLFFDSELYYYYMEYEH